jgi:hypothetical protein
MSREKTPLHEGMGVKPVGVRPSFPQVETMDSGPTEGASIGSKPATPRPSFPSPQQQQQQAQPPPQNTAPSDNEK